MNTVGDVRLNCLSLVKYDGGIALASFLRYVGQSLNIYDGPPRFKIPFVLLQDPNIKVVNPSINPCALLTVTTFA